MTNDLFLFLFDRKPKENDVSINTLSDSKDDDSKLESPGDITIDSVKDHLGYFILTL